MSCRAAPACRRSPCVFLRTRRHAARVRFVIQLVNGVWLNDRGNLQNVMGTTGCSLSEKIKKKSRKNNGSKKETASKLARRLRFDTTLSTRLTQPFTKLIAPLMRAFTTDQLIGPDWVRGHHIRAMTSSTRLFSASTPAARQRLHLTADGI
jgi:hypothetical protein